MPQFDMNTDFVIPVMTESGKQKITVRYPVEDEWAEWTKRKGTIITNLGRGESLWEPEETDADVRLYNAIRCEGQPDLNTEEARAVIIVLTKFEVRGVESEGNELEVTAAVMGGEVTHRLKIPTAKQVAEFRRYSSQLIAMPFNRQRLKTMLKPGVKLWDTTLVSTSGYANGSIPAVHKDSAVRAVLEYVGAETDEPNP